MSKARAVSQLGRALATGAAEVGKGALGFAGGLAAQRLYQENRREIRRAERSLRKKLPREARRKVRRLRRSVERGPDVTSDAVKKRHVVGGGLAAGVGAGHLAGTIQGQREAKRWMETATKNFERTRRPLGPRDPGYSTRARTPPDFKGVFENAKRYSRGRTRALQAAGRVRGGLAGLAAGLAVAGGLHALRGVRKPNAGKLVTGRNESRRRRDSVSEAEWLAQQRAARLAMGQTRNTMTNDRSARTQPRDEEGQFSSASGAYRRRRIPRNPVLQGALAGSVAGVHAGASGLRPTIGSVLGGAAIGSLVGAAGGLGYRHAGRRTREKYRAAQAEVRASRRLPRENRHSQPAVSAVGGAVGGGIGAGLGYGTGRNIQRQMPGARAIIGGAREASQRHQVRSRRLIQTAHKIGGKGRKGLARVPRRLALGGGAAGLAAGVIAANAPRLVRSVQRHRRTKARETHARNQRETANLLAGRDIPRRRDSVSSLGRALRGVGQFAVRGPKVKASLPLPGGANVGLEGRLSPAAALGAAGLYAGYRELERRRGRKPGATKDFDPEVTQSIDPKQVGKAARRARGAKRLRAFRGLGATGLLAAGTTLAVTALRNPRGGKPNPAQSKRKPARQRPPQQVSLSPEALAKLRALQGLPGSRELRAYGQSLG